MAEAIRADITAIRGDDLLIQATLEEVGSISGWTFTAAVRTKRNEDDSVTPVLTKSSGDGITISDPGSVSTVGVIDIALTDDETLSLFRRPYWWSLKRADAGAEHTIVHGILDARNSAAR